LYPVVADVLLDTLQAFLKEAWTPNTEHSWREALQIIQGNMLLAYPAEEQ
jgi:hemoglobin-like flavoprotein